MLRRTALLACSLVMAGAPAVFAAPGDPGETRLMITVSGDTTTTALLKCNPASGINHKGPRRACAALASVNGDLNRLLKPERRPNCDLGPGITHNLWGFWKGREVLYSYTNDPCEKRRPRFDAVFNVSGNKSIPDSEVPIIGASTPVDDDQ